MDIIESYAEIFAGLILLLASVVLITDNIIDPAYEQIEYNMTARADKAATFTNSLDEALGVHDQHVGRTPGVDPASGYDRTDSGMSRMYFRPEQFVLLPAVDTDISSNPNVSLGSRRNVVSSNYDIVGTPNNANEHRGLVIGQDSFKLERDYLINRTSLYDRQYTYDSFLNDGLLAELRGLAVYSNPGFGTQINGQPPMEYGGFNITVDSTIDPLSGKHSNSVIFVTGRVPTK